ncbi:SRPBCC family protein [Halogranum rubrum]|uniref:Polyketide cyclase / dehydrase and lipid transport n=1 Tax=Halogranum salarium B-1 TaxID=1210908 RepID=J3JGR9_9EURY|nr:SRPBCC family protein [Halogranum salarium]EJN60374.1 polyketide cyclase / dehydrase and lipid transport [Halogranum salarium B-1]
MDEIVVTTVVYVPPEEAYDFLMDFSTYTRYSKHLKEVRTHGDGSPGTEYEFRLAWWKLTYTARSEVTELTPPERIDWKITKDIDAHGCWRIEALDDLPDDAPADAETACRVWFEIRFDADSANSNALDLPRFISFDRVLDKVKPVVVKEAEHIVERIVADLEGRRRPVELTIEDKPSGV